MKKNVVFWVGVKNKKYSEKYGGWEWMDITRKSWEQVQSNIGKFQNTFGMSNMIIIDNSKDDKELTTIVINKCSQAVRRLLGNKIKSYTAKRWMATERRLKRR